MLAGVAVMLLLVPVNAVIAMKTKTYQVGELLPAGEGWAGVGCVCRRGACGGGCISRLLRCN